jgi:hypothetical protein
MWVGFGERERGGRDGRTIQKIEKGAIADFEARYPRGSDCRACIPTDLTLEFPLILIKNEREDFV